MPDPEAGMSPFRTVLELRGDFEFGKEPVVTCEGPEEAVPKLAESGSHTRKYDVRMGAEGICLFTAEAEDRWGRIRKDTVAMAVMERAGLDAVLSGRWHEMREFLLQNDTGRAVRFFAASTREAFGEVFGALPEEAMNRMARDMADVQFIRMRKNTVEYDLRKTEDGRTYSYYLMFIKDEDGLWKIRAF